MTEQQGPTVAVGFNHDVENLRNLLEHERVMESNVNDVYTPRLSHIYAAMAGLSELEAQIAALTAQVAGLQSQLVDVPTITPARIAALEVVIAYHEAMRAFVPETRLLRAMLAEAMDKQGVS